MARSVWLGRRGKAHTRHPGERGFSLVELMVVVVIIAALAVVAVPATRAQLKNRWTEEAAQQVTVLYRTARMQSLGRGSAVMFRYQSSPPTGHAPVEVFEAVRGGPDLPCAPLPVSNCQLANWDNALLIGSFDPSRNKRYHDLALVAQGPTPSAATLTGFDVCFSPLGTSFVRNAGATTLTPFTGVITFNVFEDAGGQVPLGLTRRAMLLSNGTARMGVSSP